MEEIKPQEGPQERFLASSADVAVYGGGAGGGKTFACIMESTRHIDVPGFGVVFFRRTTKQIRNEGGLWDESEKMYPHLNGIPSESILKWNFPKKTSITFAHLEHEKNKRDWQGAQIPLIIFDELTHFTETQFFYLLSRNRSVCGIKPYTRATTNPKNGSWVKRLIQWWIDVDTGYAIPERSGVLRWFIRIKNQIIWGDSREELIEKYGDDQYPLSFTFISAKLEDNPKMMEADPGYRAKLRALPEHERLALEEGNWNSTAQEGSYFKDEYWKVVDFVPEPLDSVVRYWDRAGTLPNPLNPDPDWTAGVKIGRGRSGSFYILNVTRFRVDSSDVEQMIKNVASQDGDEVKIWLEEDPGSAGKFEASYLIKQLVGYAVESIRPSGDKETRAKPYAAQVKAGNVYLLRGDWNQDYKDECRQFPHGKKDQVDASSGGFSVILTESSGEFTDDMAEYNETELEERW